MRKARTDRDGRRRCRGRVVQHLVQRATIAPSKSKSTAAPSVRDAPRDFRRELRTEQLRWYSERIHAAREVMDHDVARPHSLYQLSSAVAMSPFVFARVFRELIGVPPHQYLLRRRMQRARSLLESGMTVTDTCYEVGFNNPAHFTRSYRRHFGTLPSAVTSSARSET